uniref:Translation initiation factor IF-3 n=1 Tax=candidate division WOR-3 bacterium TaxID=2052148 RepID=A0A7V1EJ15_UNCW3
MQNKGEKIKNLPKVNNEIRAEKVKLVDENRQYMGVFDIAIALRIARERGYDLVEVSPDAQPPVCRLMDFGKYVYEKKRRERESRKHQHQTQVREMRLSMKISEHDYQVKLNKIKEFLEKGDRVKIKLRLRGRELLHSHLGVNLVERVVSDLKDIAREESPPKQEEQIIMVTLIPQKRRTGNEQT